MTNITVAKVGCPCINSSTLLEEYSNCQTEDGMDGVFTSLRNNSDWICFPVSYGSDRCDVHDSQVEPSCKGDDPPGFCKEAWCYVDANLCRKTAETYYLTDIGIYRAIGLELYYSYSTCGSDEEPWSDYTSTQFLDGKNLSIAIPSADSFPRHFKAVSNSSANITELYYNDNIPWKGWIVDYFNEVARISNLGEITYTHRSGGSDVKSPSDPWTATVFDVHAGIASLGLSNFFITPGRLQLAPFTVPLDTYKFYLYVKEPVTAVQRDTFGDHLGRALTPFAPSLWYLILAGLVMIACLSLVFASKDGELGGAWSRMRSLEWKRASILKRAKIFITMSFDAFLFTSTLVMTDALYVNHHDSQAQKLMNFGVAFSLLILISAYTANLAAFLTASITDLMAGSITGIDAAIAQGITMCFGINSLRKELSRNWPSAKVIYPNDYFAAFDSGLCDIIIESENLILSNDATMAGFCNRNLIRVGDPVLEEQIAFPVRADIAAGISYWINVANSLGISYSTYEQANRPDALCSFDPPVAGQSVNDLAQLQIKDVVLPLLVTGLCIVVAMFVHLWDCRPWTKKKKKRHSIHRESIFHSTANYGYYNGSIGGSIPPIFHLDNEHSASPPLSPQQKAAPFPKYDQGAVIDETAIEKMIVDSSTSSHTSRTEEDKPVDHRNVELEKLVSENIEFLEKLVAAASKKQQTHNKREKSSNDIWTC